MVPVPWEIKTAEHPGNTMWEEILVSPEQKSTAGVPVRHLLTRETSS